MRSANGPIPSAYEESNLNEEDIKEEMEERTGGAKTVPQIFIDGKHIVVMINSLKPIHQENLTRF